MSGPNALMIIPISTVLLALIWPIRPIHAGLLTLVMQMGNFIMSFATGILWERDRGEGIAVFISIMALNAALVAIIGWYRLRRMQQRR